MKKYFSIAGYVIFYLFIVFAFSLGVQKIWFSGILPKAVYERNYDLISFISFVLVLAVFVLVFKLRGKNLIKTCNFSKLSIKNFLQVFAAGILMGVFTCFLCNTSFVVENVPVFEQFLTFQVNGYTSFIIFIPMIAITFAFEEIIFRGTIFNEIRSGVPVYPSILITTAIYGLINTYTMGAAIGLYASIAALLYNLAYVYMRSIFAPIVLQISSIWVIAITIKTGVWYKLRDQGDAFLAIILAVILVLILAIYYFIYMDSRKNGHVENNTIPV
ncbi:MAG: CPBP family intramembrane metalloprotease [Clostridia bacterium]|nr:CPBP family intramembrane metalloprotease [Clostridia bacterium]